MSSLTYSAALLAAIAALLAASPAVGRPLPGKTSDLLAQGAGGLCHKALCVRWPLVPWCAAKNHTISCLILHGLCNLHLHNLPSIALPPYLRSDRWSHQ